MAHLPPSADSGWAMKASQTIDAPVEIVWKVLLDFPSYAEWNPFVRKQVVTDKANNVLDNQTAVEGAMLNMTTNIPPSMSPSASARETRVTISHVDHDKHTVSWVFDSMPSFLLRSVRWQSVTATEDGKSRYESIEVFSGSLVSIMKIFIGSDLKKAFDGMAEGLKKRSEQRQAAQAQ
ncbi:hypothetical protein BXZ70DRAFT_1005787 [Cristinia sonorae]|uniref:Coenzyme Q-binding protein COQ10 START domain-containing protein n=1 Tax=Cristinia sonorae TaxID=1940300 RepID=A0A8K0UT65_9AGAR|nr:hypothetical protein BXZ70DRAFT_1005787 [Cristinia sonorae]